MGIGGEIPGFGGSGSYWVRSLRGLAAALVVGLGIQAAHGQTTWSNIGTNFNTAGNWSLGVPTAAQVGQFSAASVSFNPKLSANITALGLQFNLGTAGWTFTGTAGGAVEVLTLGASGIVNNAVSTQTFNDANLSLLLGAAAPFTSNSTGALSFGSNLGGIANGGFALTLGGTSTNTLNAIGSVISGTGGLTKSGAGSWTLSGTNTYTGVTSITAGTLSVATIGNGGVAGNLGNATNAAGNLVLGGGTLQYTGATASTNRNFTLTAATTSTIDVSTAATNLTISGASASTTGALTKAGTGTLTLSGANAHTGTTTVSAGTLSITNATSLGTVAAGTVVSSGASLELQGGITVGAEALTISGTGSASNGALRNLSGTNTYGGLLTLGAAATIQSDAGTLALTNTGTISGATFGLTLTGSGNGSLASIIGTTSGTLTKSGSGTWTLTGANTYTGATTLSAGNLTLTGANGAAVSSASYTLNGGTFTIDNAASNNGNRLNNTGGIALNGGNLSFIGNTAANTTETVGAITGTGNSVVTLAFGGTNSLVVTAASFGHSAGNGSILLNGANLGRNNVAGSVSRLISTAVPTLLGTTPAATTGINAAVKNTVIVPFLVGEATAASGGLGTATGTANTFLTHNATTGFRPLNPTDEFTQNAITAGNNTRITSATTAAATASINSLVIAGGDLSINNAVTLTDSSGALLFTTSNAIKPTATTGILTFGAEAMITVNSGITGTISTVISGANALTKSGTGTLTLSGVNTFTGATTIASGTLSVGTIGNGGVAGNLGQATTAAANLVLSGGTLQYTGATASTNRNFTLLAGTTSTIDVTTNNLTMSGASTATTGSLTKAGAGTLTLTGTNLYTGATTINAGTLSVATIGNGGASGNLGAATNAATNLVLGGGTLQYTGATATTNRNFTLTTGTTSTIDVSTPATTLTMTGATTATTGSLTKAGNGTLTLSGTNLHTGTTNVSAGTLLAASNSALGTGTGSSTVSTGAALGLSGTGLSVGNSSANISIAGNGVSNSGAIYNVSGSNTLNSNLTLSAAARLGSAAGTLTLGPTAPNFTVSGHTQPTENSFITLGDPISGSNLTFSGAGNITVNSRIRDYSGQVAGMSFTNPTTVAYQPVAPASPGNVTIDMTSGTASVTYQANANSYTGTTFVKNGTLILNTKNNTVAPHDSLTDSFHAINGPLVIGNGSTTGTVRLNSAFGPNEPLAINTPVTLYSDGTLDLNGAGTTIDTLTFITGGTVLTGGGILYLNNNVAFNSTANGQTATIGTTANDGTLSLELNKSATLPNPDIDNGVGATRTFTITPVSAGNTATLTVNSTVIRGDVVKNGDGLLVFNGNNTYLGSTTVNAGILRATRGDDASFFSALGAADGSDAKGTTVANGATLQLSGGITISKEKLNLNGDGFNSGGALQNLSGNNTWGAIGNINLVTNSRINSDAGLLTITSNLTSTGNDKALKVGGVGNTTISGQINTGTGGTTTVTKDGTGTLTLNGSNGYQGLTDIQAGIVVARNNDALGSALAGTQVTSGAALHLENNITTPAEALTLNGAGISSGGALRNTSGSNTFGGQVTIGSSATRINSDTGTMTLTGGISTGGNAFIVGGAGNTTTTGSVGGLGALTKDGAGTANFSGTVGLGDITMNAGTLGFSGGISTVAGNVTVNAGTINFTGAGNSTTVGRVSLLGNAVSTINVGASTTLNTSEFSSSSNSTLNIAAGGVVNANYNVGNTTYSGDITGSGTFKALGTGQVTFNENITNTSLSVFIGGTSIGTMASPLTFTITGTTALSFGSLRITGDTILDFGDSSASSLTSLSLLIDAGVKVTVQNWISLTDFWKVTSTFSQTSGPASVPDALGTNPQNQITFTGFSNQSTSWITIGTYPSYFDKEIRPVPEPSTYGAMFISGCLAFLGYRRYRSRQEKK